MVTCSEILHRFSSVLPNGSARAKDGWTLLDCIYHEADRTYYVLDLLCWRNLELYDCTCEFRLFFLRSKYAEEVQPRGAGNIEGVKSTIAYRIMPLLYYDCDPAGLQKAYQDFTPFQRDGLLFLNKQGYYEFGLNPLMLLWKDTHTSRFLGHLTDNSSGLKCVLSVGLEPLQTDGSAEYPISTLEDLVVGRMSEADMMASGLLQARDEKGTEPSVLVRFSCVDVNTAEDGGGEMMMHGLRFEKRCSVSRAMPDPWSKIVFQSRARAHIDETIPCITIQDILKAASRHVSELEAEDEDEQMC